MVKFLLLVPVLVLLLLAVLKRPKDLHIVNAFGSIALFGVGAAVIYKYFQVGIIREHFIVDFYVDSISILMLGIIITIFLCVALYAIGYLRMELQHRTMDEKEVRKFYALVYAFVMTMVLSVMVANLGMMWVSIEATTLASAFLVAFYNDEKALEAAWKYILICSVGIALAFLGIIFLHMSSIKIVEGTGLELSWPFLFQNAADLNVATLRLAFIFILVGFGTKAGLAPMYTWLPDAHSQAPTPISALLSAVLLNSAMYGIIRCTAIVNKAVGHEFAGRLLLVLGFLSLVIAAVFIMTQKDFKRLLAYSSIEHMGIVAIGLGLFTPLSLFAALFHMVNHSLNKTLLFMSAGNVYMKYQSKEVDQIRGVLSAMPLTGAMFLLGIFAITGMPPFGVFVSEIGVVTAFFKDGNWLLGVALIILLTTVFAGFAVSLLPIFYRNKSSNLPKGEISKLGTGVIVVLLGLMLVMGIHMPSQLMSLLVDGRDILYKGGVQWHN